MEVKNRMESIKKTERNHHTWLANYQGNSLKQNKTSWKYWTQYLGTKDEDWIFENRDIEDWSSHMVNFHRWLKNKNLSDNTCSVRINTIRGYFKHIGIAVSFSRVQTAEICNIESSPLLDYPFNLKVKEQLLRVSDVTEEYIVSVGISFGLRVGDFSKLTRGMLEPLIEETVPIQLPKIMTKKEGVPAYPFIDRDAQTAIKNMLEIMDAENRTNPKSRMLKLNQRQINQTFRNLFKKANVPIGAYRVRFHILRKFLTDALSRVCSGDKWKHLVGKSANSPYITSEGRDTYAKVMEFTCVNGDKLRKNSSAALDDLKAIIAEQQTEIKKQDTKIEALATELLEEKELIQGLLEIVAKLQNELTK
jgi:hypothetical protein